MISLSDRVFGCLLGGAYGDALGWPVEFLSESDIVERYGPNGITGLDSAMSGQVTDDTQMTLFTVEGLIRGWVRQSIKGIGHTPSIVHHAYLRWLDTQDPGHYHRTRDQQPDGWLIGDSRLYARRAPGNTCMAALRETEQLGQEAINSSKGCGAVMRSAPFGFLDPFDESRCFEVAVNCARCTHGHPSGFLAAGAFAAIINLLARGYQPCEAVAQAITLSREIQGSKEVCDALVTAVTLAQRNDWRDMISELGQGWVAEEALAISALCVLAAESPMEALLAAVNHGGDSDSTGSMVGNMLGTSHGPSIIPTDCRAQLELTDVIQRLATDFSSMLMNRLDANEIWDCYPGH